MERAAREPADGADGAGLTVSRPQTAEAPREGAFFMATREAFLSMAAMAFCPRRCDA
jgi:hypothetical protein